MESNKRKYVIFVLIIVAGVALDQWTKKVASENLATTRPGHVQHVIQLETDAEDNGKTVREFLSEEFTSNSDDELDAIANRYVRTADGRYLTGSTKLEEGQQLEVTNREVVVVEDYFDFQYTENRGAAFGMLDDHDASWRLPFFIAVSLIAVAMILYILHGVPANQRIIVWGLSFIAAGAVGNFIDRIRFGYVIDFIVWKYTDAYRWPTFNIADSMIVIGVALMIIELIRDGFAEHPDREAASGGEAEADDQPPDSDDESSDDPAPTGSVSSADDAPDEESDSDDSTDASPTT